MYFFAGFRLQAFCRVDAANILHCEYCKHLKGWVEWWIFCRVNAANILKEWVSKCIILLGSGCKHFAGWMLIKSKIFIICQTIKYSIVKIFYEYDLMKRMLFDNSYHMFYCKMIRSKRPQFGFVHLIMEALWSSITYCATRINITIWYQCYDESRSVIFFTVLSLFTFFFFLEGR